MTDDLITLLRELCCINGASGDEGAVREYILGKIGGLCKCTVDPLGNIIADHKGRKTPAKKLMISAHMDEVGLIITSVRSDGTLSFDCVGGVDADAAAGRQVTVMGRRGSLDGCVGSKAVHNMSAEEKKSPPKFDGLYIDIGARDKADAEKYVRPGDYAYFRADYTKMGSCIRSKSIDDRAGCAIMINMIQSGFEYDCTFTFVVQEEIGLRGARTAAYTAAPDLALVLEATTAADIPLSEGEKRCCELGKGPVVSYMDRSTVYDRELYALAGRTAEKNGIPWQTKTVIAGGNDSGAIHLSRGGVRTIALSVPCRYLHTPSCVISESDYHNTAALAKALAAEILSLC
ncbi:MAG: M42 family metallopeptidase [Huintestinicola sp.]